MLVFTFAALSLLGAVAVLAIPAKEIVFAPAQLSEAENPLSTNLSCSKYQTECRLGCCPYSDGVCCSNGNKCCQHGQVCYSHIGICIELVNVKEEDLALVTSRATPVENPRIPCPRGTTTCGHDKCCVFPSATCCSDGKHCCPHGYRCDLPNKQCVKNSFNIYSTNDISETYGMRAFEPFKTVRKDSYKSCPGGTRQCPSYMSCCLDGNDDWSCCPKPAHPPYRKEGSNECCDTISGYICCPPYQHCTYLGCI